MAFYPPGDFWVSNRVDLWDYAERLHEMLTGEYQSGGLGARFKAEMSEEVIAYRERDYTLKICRDGMVLFTHQRLEWKKALAGSMKESDNMWRLAYRYANCINLLFHSAIIKAEGGVAEVDIRSFREVSNQDVSLFAYEADRALVDFPQPYKAHHARFRRRNLAASFDEHCLFDMLHLRSAPVFQSRVYDILNFDLHKLQGHDDEVADSAILAQSYGQFKMGNNSVALILAWFVIETYINEMWNWILENTNRTYPGGQRRINSDRMKDLKKGQNYSASTRANTLELMGVIAFDMFENIDKVRLARNKVVHRRHDCSLEEAGMGLRVASNIIREKSGVDIRLDFTQFTST